MKTSSKQRQGKLVICPTPLGNLGDMPPRALDALRSADVVCCEDTRVTGKLLAAFGIEGKRLERLDEATIGSPANRVSAAGGSFPSADVTVGDTTIARVLAGETIVYCSDAGMPGVSDPGQRLVALARACGAPVEVLPGPTAATTAYAASGFLNPHFYFGGFFPRKVGERKKLIEFLKTLDAVAIFYESPKRIASALEAVATDLPLRPVAVCRELSKLHEEVVVACAADLAQQFAERERNGGIKGEIVMVLDAPSIAEREGAQEDAMGDAQILAEKLIAEGALSKKEIVSRLQSECGLSRNSAYQLVHGV